MVGDSSRMAVQVGYGARPVSVQLIRGRVLAEASDRPAPGRVVVAPPIPARDSNAADRLSAVLHDFPAKPMAFDIEYAGGIGLVAAS